jgi:hypothetical protein
LPKLHGKEKAPPPAEPPRDGHAAAATSLI